MNAPSLTAYPAAPDTEDARQVLAQSDASAIYTLFVTGPKGLTESEAQARLRHFGPNTLKKASHPGAFLKKILANFTHLMAMLLWVGGGVAFIAGMPELGWAVWLVVAINGSFSFWQEFKAEKSVEALSRLLPSRVVVLRDGTEKQILADKVVPGDMIRVGEGDRIPADARLVNAADLRVDESALTGESHPVGKKAAPLSDDEQRRTPSQNILLTGTTVTAGDGLAVVCRTGMDTEFGRIAKLTQALNKELSPLQREVQVVTKVVSLVAVGSGLIFFGLALALTGMGPAESFLFALGMIVAFVPEGLLPTVTLALALGIQRMAKRNAIVKRLSSVETLGCATVICTDKTGTLTRNEMTASKVWVAGRILSVIGSGYSPEGRIMDAGQKMTSHDSDLQSLVLALSLCNNAHLTNPTTPSDSWTMIGDPTEGALLCLARKAGLDPTAEIIRRPRIREIPFDSHRRRMSTMHDSGEGLNLFMKGGPREVLALCTHLRMNGQEIALIEAARAEILNAFDDLARQGFRVLAGAGRIVEKGQLTLAAEQLEQNLTFLGLAALFDPPRKEVPEAVVKCHRAGIRVIMITGDYGLTASGIAKQIGLHPTNDPRVVTGSDVDAMRDVELKDALNQEVIFARATPEHKLRVVTALKEMGHVVAVTGDGVNDAPALKAADIGVAMGLTGTDTAKEAADMILTDDNFASIVSAVEEGRTVYDNIKTFTSYIFTSNAPEAVPFILHALSGGRIPLALTIMQVLAVDLGTDIVPALALGAEKPRPGIMDKPPRKRSEHVVTWALLKRAYLWLGAFQALAAMTAFYFQYWISGYFGQWFDLPGQGSLYASATAMTLACIVTTQIGNLFAQRAEHIPLTRLDFFSNRLAWYGIAVELFLVACIIYVPPLQRVFGTTGIGLANWLFLLAFIPLLPLVDEVRKRVCSKEKSA